MEASSTVWSGISLEEVLQTISSAVEGTARQIAGWLDRHRSQVKEIGQVFANAAGECFDWIDRNRTEFDELAAAYREIQEAPERPYATVLRERCFDPESTRLLGAFIEAQGADLYKLEASQQALGMALNAYTSARYKKSLAQSSAAKKLRNGLLPVSWTPRLGVS